MAEGRRALRHQPVRPPSLRGLLVDQASAAPGLHCSLQHRRRGGAARSDPARTHPGKVWLAGAATQLMHPPADVECCLVQKWVVSVFVMFGVVDVTTRSLLGVVLTIAAGVC
jgi:hypothetical protein